MVKPSISVTWRQNASQLRNLERERFDPGFDAHNWNFKPVGLGPGTVVCVLIECSQVMEDAFASKHREPRPPFPENLLVAWSAQPGLPSHARTLEELQSELYRTNTNIRESAVKFVRAQFEKTHVTPHAVRKQANDLVLNLEQMVEGIAEKRKTENFLETFKQIRSHSDAVKPELVPGYDAAVAAGEDARARIFSSLEMVNSTELARLMGVTREMVHHQRQKGALLALTHGTRQLRYPRWQAEPRVAEVMPRLLEALGKLKPWTKYLFITQRNPSLNAATPLDALRHGDSARVLALAAEYAESMTPA